MDRPHVEITEEDLRRVASGKPFCDANWIKATEGAITRVKKLSFKKVRDAGLHCEDYNVIRNALDVYLEYLKKEKPND